MNSRTPARLGLSYTPKPFSRCAFLKFKRDNLINKYVLAHFNLYFKVNPTSTFQTSSSLHHREAEYTTDANSKLHWYIGV